MIISAYSEERRNNKETPAGAEIETTYGYEIDKKGQKILKENGKENVYEKIQEYLEDTKIENVIQRVIAGDTSILRPDGIYEDITNMPNNLMEAMNQINALEKTYNELSNEMKKKYPTLEKFIEKSGQIEWLQDMGYIEQTKLNTETVKETTTEVKEETNES